MFSFSKEMCSANDEILGLIGLLVSTMSNLLNASAAIFNSLVCIQVLDYILLELVSIS